MEQEVSAYEAAWRQYFNLCRVEPFRVVYKGLGQVYEETAWQAVEFLDIPIPPGLAFGERQLKRQADKVTEEWVRRISGANEVLYNPSQELGML